MPLYKAFTLKNDTTVLRALLTPCGVCMAYNPVDPGTHPEIHNFMGLWDTGATGSVISKNVVDSLGLKPIGKTKVYHADGESIVNVYAVNLVLPNKVDFPFVKVTEGKLTNCDLLIGMDIITQGDFSVTNFGGKTTFSFRVPSVKEIDYVADAKTGKSGYPGASKNRPCPCGSGKNYKNCCQKYEYQLN